MIIVKQRIDYFSLDQFPTPKRTVRTVCNGSHSDCRHSSVDESANCDKRSLTGQEQPLENALRLGLTRVLDSKLSKNGGRRQKNK